MKRQKDIVHYLEMSGNKELTFRNFNLNQRFLGLKPEFEMVRPSMTSVNTGKSPQQSMFAEYYRDIPGSSISGFLDNGSTRKVTDFFPLQIMGGTIILLHNYLL